MAKDKSTGSGGSKPKPDRKPNPVSVGNVTVGDNRGGTVRGTVTGGMHQ